MSITIGPITIPFADRLNFSNRRQVVVTQIPAGRNTGYTAGTEMKGYQIGAASYATTIAAAKALRQQLHELVSNPHIDFVYIGFSLDDEEHGGWYLIDDVSTDVLPSVFGDYPLSMTVKRLGTPGSHLPGTYWRNSALTNDWGFTGQTIVTLPNIDEVGALREREGDGGSSYYLVNHATQTVSYPLPATASDMYDCRCRVQDTVTADNTTESEFVDVYGPEHTWSGDAIFGNDLVRFRWYSSDNTTSLEVYDLGAADWVEVADDFEIYADSSQYTAYKPILTKFHWDRVEWQIIYATATDDTLIINYSLNRGTYYIALEIKTNVNGLDAETGLTTPSGVVISQVENSQGSAAPAVGLSTDPASNYAAARLDSSHYFGYLYLDQPAGQPVASTTTKLYQGIDIGANTTYYMAIFAADYPLPGSLNLSALGLEYIGNVSQWLVLVEPDQVTVLNSYGAGTDNILLESGTDNLLLEDGGFILLE